MLDLALKQGRITSDRYVRLYRVAHVAVKGLNHDEVPFCEAQIRGVCTKLFQDIHHKAKRGAWLTTYTPLFMAVCRRCHDYIENNRDESIKKGWIVELTDDQRAAIARESQEVGDVGYFQSKDIASYNGDD